LAAVGLSVCCLTVDPPAQVASVLARLRPVADEVVVAVDSRVDTGALGPYVEVADRVWRYEFRDPVDRPRAWLHAQCTHDWILSIDGDEVPSRRLVEQLPDLVAAKDVVQYAFPRRWLYGTTATWLGELPWWPDFQVRLVRNGPALAVRGGLHGGVVAVQPGRHVDAPLYHLDFLVKSEAERRAKARAYEEQRPGGTAYGGGPLNDTLYVPEDRKPEDLCDVPAADREWIEHALAGRRAPPTPWPDGRDLMTAPANDIDALAPVASLPAGAHAANVELYERDRHMSPGERRPVYVRVRNLGNAAWPWGWEQEPAIRVSYHWRAIDGTVLTFEGLRTPLTARIAPGDEQIVPVWVDAPMEPGRYLLEFDLVHEHVQWFETPLTVEMCVGERDEC
jgi:hypothetical protein